MPQTLAEPVKAPQAPDAPRRKPAADAGHCRLVSYHCDPGHGWVETTLDELKRLEIADKISGYSYMHAGTVYLEEDCDAPKYLEALNADGQKFRLIHKIVDFDHPCRCLPRYDATQFA